MNKNAQIAAAAQGALSANFIGYEGGEYVGAGDLALDFTGSGSSFLDEGAGAQQFTVTITNKGTAAENQILALFPGYFGTASDIKDGAGMAAAAIVTDGTVISTADKEVVCTGSPKAIAEFQAFCKRNPTRFTGMKMLVDNAEQFEKPIYIKKLSPFKNLEDYSIVPSTYKESSQMDDKRCEIPLTDFQLDDQTTVVFTLLAGRSVTFTFFAGAIQNPAAELNKKAVLARQTIQRDFQ